MIRLSSIILAVVMLFAFSEAMAQGNSDGKGKAHQKIAICHNGHVIWVNVASIPAHAQHEDSRAVQNSDGEWVCPCLEPTEPAPAPLTCDNGTLIFPEWDIADCEWYYPEECPEPGTTP